MRERRYIGEDKDSHHGQEAQRGLGTGHNLPIYVPSELPFLSRLLNVFITFQNANPLRDNGFLHEPVRFHIQIIKWKKHQSLAHLSWLRYMSVVICNLNIK